eukprot:2420085-Rhodomonas_salina.1
MACKSQTTLQAFKTEFLTDFEGTYEGEVTTYLGCKLIWNRADRTILFRQAAYTCKILQLYGAWDKQAVKTQLEAGVLLSKADSPEVADSRNCTAGTRASLDTCRDSSL